VAGVLYNARFRDPETGNPGGDAMCGVVTRAFVPSGVPGLRTFTVESFSPSKLNASALRIDAPWTSTSNQPDRAGGQSRISCERQPAAGGIPGGGFPGRSLRGGYA
jgi:hypothetical protein